ncbi:MAG: sugar ABC transporter permease [Lachnospiraceae bacterium]|nr:sugar ABC transporter permease [Lachnospiraceae bacterium]
MFWTKVKRDFKRNWTAYVFAIPVIAYYLIFHYKPMVGVVIAFKDFRPAIGIWESEWVGLQHFKDYISSYYFWRLIRNTLRISVTNLIVSFPAPIIFALLVNEVRNDKFKKTIQTISYLPHFVSMVVICGLVKLFVGQGGLITQFFMLFGRPDEPMLADPNLYVPIHVLSGVWAGIGWGSILYLSALSGINEELYEAAEIDGANRWKQTLHVTLPGISTTIITKLLLDAGHILSVGYEKIILLYNEKIYETADVISSFTYRRGLLDFQWSFSTAVGLFNSVINFILINVFNKISKKVTEVGLW